MENIRIVTEGLEHWIQNEENGVCFIPLNLCNKILSILKEQQKRCVNEICIKWPLLSHPDEDAIAKRDAFLSHEPELKL